MLSFILIALSVFIGLCTLAGAGYGLWLLWRYKWSIRIVGPSFVALPIFLGKIGHICQSPAITYCTGGQYYVPYCFGLKWDGHDPWELAMITKEWFKFFFPGTFEDKVWSKDHQRLLVDVACSIRLPFEDRDSLALLVESKIPTYEVGLKARVKEEVFSAVRNVLAEYDHDVAIGTSKIEEIRKKVKGLLFLHTGLFCRSGICGKDPSDLSPGTGEVIVRVETVNPTEKLSDAMEAPVVAKYGVKTAKYVADADAHNAGVVPKAYAEWLKTKEGKNASGEIKKLVFEAIRQGKLSKDGHYTEQISRNLIGSPDGSPLPRGLTYLSLGGGGPGVFVKGNRGEGDSGDKGKLPEDMTPEELRVWAEKKGK